MLPHEAWDVPSVTWQEVMGPVSGVCVQLSPVTAVCSCRGHPEATAPTPVLQCTAGVRAESPARLPLFFSPWFLSGFLSAPLNARFLLAALGGAAGLQGGETQPLPPTLYHTDPRQGGVGVRPAPCDAGSDSRTGMQLAVLGRPGGQKARP